MILSKVTQSIALRIMPPKSQFMRVNTTPIMRQRTIRVKTLDCLLDHQTGVDRQEVEVVEDLERFE